MWQARSEPKPESVLARDWVSVLVAGGLFDGVVGGGVLGVVVDGLPGLDLPPDVGCVVVPVVGLVGLVGGAIGSVVLAGRVETRVGLV